MLQADTQTVGPEQAAPLASESGSSSESAASDCSDGTARGQQVEPTATDAEVPHRHAPAPEAGVEAIRKLAEATVEGVPSIARPGDEQAAAIGPEVPPTPERVEAKVTDRPDGSRPEASVAKTEAAPERPIPAPSSDRLAPPSDALPSDALAAGTGRDDPAQTPQLQAGPALTGGGAVAPVAAVAPDTGVTIARQSPPRAPGSRIARGAGDSAGAPALPTGASPTERARPGAPAGEQGTPSGGDHVARAVEPRRALAPTDGTDGDDRAALRERSTPDDPFGSQVRGTDASTRQQPSSDAQPGRLPPTSNLHGIAVAGPQAATGVSGEVADVTARAVDRAAGGEPGPHSATQQVALQISKAPHQDRTEIRIRLDPPELGEVDIQLEFRDLRLSASINAERPDTLELLQRDSRSLARALREAGLELADSDLSFAHGGRDDRPDAGSYAQRAIQLAHPLPAAAPLQELAPALANPHGFVSLRDGRMDLRV
jgi:flagellar hook-length control protein FliK